MYYHKLLLSPLTKVDSITIKAIITKLLVKTYPKIPL